MPKIDNFFKNAGDKMEFLKVFVLPILVAATFFFLDNRYISKDDWKGQSTEQKAMITSLSNDQKQAFTQLTKAITALTDEQRNTAEFQRNNASAISNLAARLDKHEGVSENRDDKMLVAIDKLDARLNRAEASGALQDNLINKSIDSINRLTDRIGILENSATKHDANIKMNSEAINRLERK